MTKTRINSTFSKSRGQVILEYVLLALCLCVIACRATYTESPHVTGPPLLTDFSGSAKSLALSAVLIFSVLAWLCFCNRGGRWRYRYTGIEVGLLIFALAGFIGLAVASDKRAAVTDLVTMTAPMLMAVLLVQILDRPARISLVLFAIAALGVVGTYQCAEQYFSSNQLLIEQYQQAPQEQLARLGIEANSLQHFLYEHRLYTKDVRGFFKTGNSAASYALLATFAGLALLIERFGASRSEPGQGTKTLTAGIVTSAVMLTFVFTRSKGAIVAGALSGGLLVIFLAFGSLLRVHARAVVVCLLILVMATGGLLVGYGLGHGRLPGGNSMLVRWEYWTGAAKMFAKHPLTGVGPGNFVSFYPYYKPAAALEAVSDPHNFLLSVLTQYGPLGLLGLLAAVMMPLYKGVLNSGFPEPKLSGGAAPALRPLAMTFLVILFLALLVLRPLLVQAELGEKAEVRLYLATHWYVVPALVFVLAYLLLSATGQPARPTGFVMAALICGIVGCLIQNCIDFAIFEPGVFSAFWAMMAVLVALDFQRGCRTPLVLEPSGLVKMVIGAGAVLLAYGYLRYGFVPVAKAASRTARAMRQVEHAEEYAHELLDEAAEEDALDPTALNLNARLYLQRCQEVAAPQRAVLKLAEARFLRAIERNEACFKNYAKLGEVYGLLAEVSSGREKTDYLNKAFLYASLAVQRYPGSGRLRVELAKTAEKLGRTNVALEHYRAAIEIEEGFRRQFRLMYPDWRLVSRLGEENYQFAKQRVEELCKQSTL